MRGLLWRLISTRLPTLQPLPSHFFDGNLFGSSLSSKSNSTNFPAILTHFSVDMVKTRREAWRLFELHWHKHLVWIRHAINQLKSTSYTVLSGDISGMSVWLSVCDPFVFTNWCISPTSTSALGERLHISTKKGQCHLHQTFAEEVWLQLWGDLVKLWGNPAADVIIWVLKDSYLSFSCKWQKFDHTELLMRLNFYVNS